MSSAPNDPARDVARATDARVGVPFEFWVRWLFLASCGFAALGVGVALFGSRLLPPWDRAIADAFFDGTIPAHARPLQDFLLGPLGGTMAGSYILQAWIVRVPFRRRERWAWQATLWSLLVWFVVDSSVSLAHGAAFNVYMINILPLVVYGVPLWATRHAFRGRGAEPQRGPTMPSKTSPSERDHPGMAPATRVLTRSFAARLVERWSNAGPQLHSVLRIVAAFMFILAGTMKVFAFPEGMPPDGSTASLLTQIGIGGLLEVVGGALLLVGLFTRPVAFILAGMMAVAYFQFHFPTSFWPTINGGIPAALYCFVWLYFSAAGAGPWSLDALRASRPTA